MTRCFFLLLTILLIGCGRVPKISENHKGLPPWEKLPEGNGITYLEKFTHDPGMEPFYLAKMKYNDDADLQRVISTFSLEAHSSLEPPNSQVKSRTKALSWYPLRNVTRLYIYPNGNQDQYILNLWVNEDEHTMIVERSWY